MSQPNEDPDEGEYEDDEEEEEELVSRITRDEKPEPVVARATPARRGARRKRIDAGVARPKSHESIWNNLEADLRWGEILEALRNGGKTGFAGGQDAYEVQITLRDLASPEASKVVTFEGASVMGDPNMSPAEMFSKKVEDIHMNRGAQGPGKYRVDFCWKHNSHPIARGVMNVDAPARIIAMRNMQMREKEGSEAFPPMMPQQPGMQPGMGRPMGPVYQPNPYPPYPPYPYAYPPGYGQPLSQESSEVAQLRADLARARETEARMQGTLDEILRAQKEGRAPNLPAQPVTTQTAIGVGAPPAMDVESVVERVLTRILPVLGIGKPAAQPQATAEDQLMKVMKEGMNTIVTKTMQQVMGGMQKSITGLGDPIDDEPEPAPAEIVPPVDPKDSLPFVPVQLEAKWPDGSPVGYAADKETGKIDWTGVAFGNPYMAVKLMEVAGKVGDAFADVVKKAGVAGPHIVHKVPENAQNGQPSAPRQNGGFGSGWE